jgi:DNA-directed RNA polymerase specialized sigma24 family protein
MIQGSMAVEEHQWSLSREAFDRLLAHLGADADAAAREYETLRRKLTVFFELRALPGAESLADEVLDRVARKLEAREPIDRLRSYCYGVASHVALERLRQLAREQAAFRELRHTPPDPEHTARAEERAALLERCLGKLSRSDRDLVLNYSREGASREGRQGLAVRLGLSYAALRTRACRIRRLLEQCLGRHRNQAARGNP